MATIYAIDLGAHTVKLAALEGAFGRYELLDYYVRAVPQELNQEPDLDRRLAALGTLLDELVGEDDSSPASAVAFPAEHASVRLLRLPFTDRKRVQQTLTFEVEAQVPFDLEQVVLDSRIVSQDQGSSNVLVGLAEKELVGRLVNGLNDWDLDPKYLTLDCDLLGQLADEGVQAVLDVGHVRTLVTVCRNGRVLATRAVSGGGRDVTAALAKRLNLAWSEAEGTKHAVSVDPNTAQVQWEEDDEVTQSVGRRDPVPIVHEALAPLLESIRATLTSYEDELELDIDEVIAVGGTSELAGFRALLATTLGVPVRTVYLSDKADEQMVPQRFALVELLGRKATGVAKGARELDFRRDEYTFKGDLAAYRHLIGAGAIAAVVFVVAAMGLFAARYVQLSRQVGGYDDQIAAVVLEAFPDIEAKQANNPATARAIVQERTTAATLRVEALESIFSDIPPTLSLLKELSEGMPKPTDARIDVSALKISEGAVTIEAETDGYESASKVEAALQDVDRFSQAQKGNEKKYKDGIQFSISIPLGTADDEEEETEEEG